MESSSRRASGRGCMRLKQVVSLILAIQLFIMTSCAVQGGGMEQEHAMGGDGTFRRSATGYVVEVNHSNQTFVLEPIKQEDGSLVLSDRVEVDYSRAINRSSDCSALSPGLKVRIAFFGSGSSVLSDDLWILDEAPAD